MPKVEAPGHPGHPPPLSDAVFKGWNVRRHLIVSNIVNAVLFLLCRLEREEDFESFLPPESLTFDVRVETDPRQVHIVICSQFQL